MMQPVWFAGPTIAVGIVIPWTKFLLRKLIVAQLGEKYPTFHGTQRFITVLLGTVRSRPAPCRLSTAAYSILVYSQVPSIQKCGNCHHFKTFQLCSFLISMLCSSSHVFPHTNVYIIYIRDIFERNITSQIINM
jgi:hypothetical protein